MKQSQTSLLLFFVLLAGIAQAQTTAAPPTRDEFVFHFQPPTGTRVTTTYHEQKTTTVEGRPQENHEIESTLEGLFKKVGDGFEFTKKTLATSTRRNGRPFPNPLLDLMAQVPLSFIISPEGTVTEIKGFAELESRIKFPGYSEVEARAKIPGFAGFVPYLMNLELAEWKGRYANFAGRKFKVGDAIDIEMTDPLPIGESLKYTVRTTFPRWEQCPAGNCVRVEQVYDSDAAAFVKFMEDLYASALSAPSAVVPEVAKSESRVSGSLSRLIDPRTMLIYSERSERIFTMQVKVPGEGLKKGKFQEIRAYVHSYDKP